MRRSGLVGIVVAGCMVAAAPRAHAAAYDFSAGSWIIPMDACYQPTQSFNGSSFAGSNQSSTVYGATTSCPDGSLAAKDGVLKAYGFVYRLLQNNVPVYYILDSTKTAVDGVDLTITSTTGTPVSQVIHSGSTSTYGNTQEFMKSTNKAISYRGAPFIISAADVPTVLNLLKTNSDFNGTDSRTGRTWFQDVWIHQAKVNILQAPVRAILMQTPPKIALLDIGGAAIGVLQGYLKDAGLFTATATASYPTIGDVFTQFTQVTDFTTSNGLIAGGFSILWAPHWEGNYTISTTQRDQVIQKITSFIDAGHPFVGQCAAISTVEGATPVSTSYGSEPATSYGHLVTTATGTTIGLKTNQLNQPTFPSGTDAMQVNPSTTVQAYLDPLTQIGDFSLGINSNSWTFDFTPASGVSYRSYIASYVQSKNAKLQIETVGHKDGDSSKGLVIYLGGHSYGSQSSSCSGSCSTFNQYNDVGLERLILNSLIFLGQVPSSTEQTRSAPIVIDNSMATMPSALVGKTYLGSYVQQTSASAAYPPWSGHFRQYGAGALSGANVTGFNSIVADWDAYDHVKTQASADARTIFTAVPVSGKLTKTDFTTANLSKLQATVPTLTTTQVTSIRQGGLGGVDHSIPAIIPPSGIAGSSTRPVVAYFGALDGMLHAVLVSGSVSGKSAGDELWAFIPPSQLAKTVAQTGGVDGSPSVGDAFIVDPTGNGINKAWRTLLAIPDGGFTGGTVDVLDVTDPTSPRYLWTASDTFTSGGKSYVMGRAQGVAIGAVMTTSGVKYAYFIATDNTNGTWGNGFNLYALDANDGSVIWRANKTYANDTTHNDVPGTVAVIDDVGDGGPVTKVFFGDLEGKVWSVGATSGSPATAVFDAAAKYLPANSVNYPIESGLVLYRDPTTSHLATIGVTGSADWVPATTLSQVFKVDLQTNAATTLTTLGAGERVYAVPTISNNSVYFITSIGNLQTAIGSSFTSTGNLMRIEFDSSPKVTTLATVKQGASEVAVDANGNVIAASATGITQISKGAADAQSAAALQNLASKPMTVRAWLDLH